MSLQALGLALQSYTVLYNYQPNGLSTILLSGFFQLVTGKSSTDEAFPLPHLYVKKNSKAISIAKPLLKA